MKQTFETLCRSLSPEESREKFAQDVLEGFSGTLKKLSSCYFYDQKGSEIFTDITNLSDYYPTRCETEVIQDYAQQIVNQVTQESNKGSLRLIELGAGDTTKPYPLIEELVKKDIDFTYIAVDISESALDALGANLEKDFPGIKFRGVVGHYFDALEYLKNESTDNELSFVLFLGSNIGNFSAEESLDFMKNIRNRLQSGDAVLCGFDLKKDTDVLLAAYSDSEGVTAGFNLNLLQRINRELGANFNLENFYHYACYNPVKSTMESFLMSSCDQEVSIEYLDCTFQFKACEPIHTEYSHKYDKASIDQLCEQSGFQLVDHYVDDKEYFIDSLWRV